VTPAVKSSPDVPGYAIAHTPKDGPSTPAVVIAPEAQSSPETSKRIFSQTIPSRVRAASVEDAPPAPASLADELDPYPPKKGKGKLVALCLGGAILLAGIFVGLRAADRQPAREQVRAGAETPVNPLPSATAPAAATAAIEVPGTAKGTSEASPAPSDEAKPVDSEPTRRPTRAGTAPPKSEQTQPASPKGKAKVVAAAPARSPAGRAPGTPIATEPSPATTKPAAGKGVIVRDAPF
jgi:hypothetical protein